MIILVRSRQENVADVKLIYFTEGENNNDLTGLARGGQQVQQGRAALVEAIETLDEAIKTTNLRVNAPENVVKPRLENTSRYIKREKEDFFRLKKMIQGYKKRKIERQLAAAKSFAVKPPLQKATMEKDEDIIF